MISGITITTREMPSAAVVVLTLLSACVEIKDGDRATPASAALSAPAKHIPGTPVGGPLDTVDISAPAYDLASLDTAGLARLVSTETPDALPAPSMVKSTDTVLTKFPARIPAKGRVTLHIQILLDRANFSPGIIDGAWGANAAKALTYFANPNSSSGDSAALARSRASIDRSTYERLRAAAGNAPALLRYTLTADDLRGPFVVIPELVYDQAKLKCLCYSSWLEAISERFHSSAKLLAQLNPGVNLDKLKAGTTLLVPNVANEGEASAADTVIIARLEVSKSGFWTHALDASGRIIYHFPSTLGAGYDPSPTGDFRVVGVSHNPAFHYQPKLFAEVPDSKPEARLPPGPNSPVGVAWIGLSKPHYGIHGTSSPETIGYANSHGCVRLTNWDAGQLSDLVQAGTPVVFR